MLRCLRETSCTRSNVCNSSSKKKRYSNLNSYSYYCIQVILISSQCLPTIQAFGLQNHHPQQRENKHCQGPTCHRKSAIQRRRNTHLQPYDSRPRWNTIHTTKSSSAAAAAAVTTNEAIAGSASESEAALHHVHVQQEPQSLIEEKTNNNEEEGKSFELLLALQILRETQPKEYEEEEDISDNHEYYNPHNEYYIDNIDNDSLDDELEDDGTFHSHSTDTSSNMLLQRRRVILHSLFASSMAILPTTSVAISTPTNVNGAIPETLDISPGNGESDNNAETFLPIRQPPRISIQKSSVMTEYTSPFSSSLGLKDSIHSRLLQTKPQAWKSNTHIPPLTKDDVFRTVLWSAALWLLAGSRSNPIIKPLANALYPTPEKEDTTTTISTPLLFTDASLLTTTHQNSSTPIIASTTTTATTTNNVHSWVQDRNDGLFTPLPPSFLFLLGTIFLFLGLCTERAILFLAEGDSDITLQLAGVSLIGGASLELGRIASGEKLKTRQEVDRAERLVLEFDEFAQRRLIFGQGGSVHRSEIIKSFRRYYTKYRTADDSILSDLEIEKLVRNWNKNTIMNAEGMSSAGFFKNIKINTQTEIR